MSLLRRKGLIFDEWSTDDVLYTFKTLIKNLPFILSMGKFKRRPNKTGNWIKDKERKLGHRILLYLLEESPKLKEIKKGEIPEQLKKYREEQHRIAESKKNK